MKEQKIYTCEICNTKFVNEQYAKDCEKTHVKPVNISKAKYKACFEYPDWIEVTFADGKRIKYNR